MLNVDIKVQFFSVFHPKSRVDICDQSTASLGERWSSDRGITGLQFYCSSGSSQEPGGGSRQLHAITSGHSAWRNSRQSSCDGCPVPDTTTITQLEQVSQGFNTKLIRYQNRSSHQTREMLKHFFNEATSSIAQHTRDMMEVESE